MNGKVTDTNSISLGKEYTFENSLHRLSVGDLYFRQEGKPRLRYTPKEDITPYELARMIQLFAIAFIPNIAHYYDYWKYNGKVSRNFLNNCNNSKIVYYCSTLYNKYNDIDELEKIFVLNAFYNHTLWLGSLNYKLYDEFVKFIESSEYFFLQQIKFLFKANSTNLNGSFKGKP